MADSSDMANLWAPKVSFWAFPCFISRNCFLRWQSSVQMLGWCQYSWILFALFARGHTGAQPQHDLPWQHSTGSIFSLFSIGFLIPESKGDKDDSRFADRMVCEMGLGTTDCGTGLAARSSSRWRRGCPVSLPFHPHSRGFPIPGDCPRNFSIFPRIYFRICLVFTEQWG